MLNLICSSYSLLNAFKYRDRMTIIGDILKSIKASRNGRKLSQIMQSANLNYIQTKKYLNYLLNCGFLIVTEKETYAITSNGLKFLQFVEIQRIHMIH